MQVLLVMALFALVVLSEVPDLVRREMKGELIAFSAVTVLAMALTLAQVLGWEYPNPTRGIEYLTGLLVNWITGGGAGTEGGG